MQDEPVDREERGAGWTGAPDEEERRVAWIVVKVLAYIATIVASIATVVSLF